MIQKNVLLIVVDQWRGDCLGALGHPCLNTPNLDRLGAEGVTFRRHYTQGTPCAPARASLITGRYLMNHRVVQAGTPWDARLKGMPDELLALGYNPAMIGYTSFVPDPTVTDHADCRFRKWGHAVMDGFHIVLTKDPGFEPYVDYLANLGYQRPAKAYDIWHPAHAADGHFTASPSVIARGHSDTAWCFDAGIDYLKSHSGEPWFLHLGTWRPHPPFIASEPYNLLYDPKKTPAPRRMASVQDEARQHPLHAYYLDRIQRNEFFQNGTGLASEMDVEEIAALRAVYYGLLSEIDDHLGRVFEFLRETGQWDNTLVIFTGDHGEMLGDHYLLGKMTYFDQAYHIPLVISDPSSDADTTRGKVVNYFTETVDVLPTILDWLGQTVPRYCDGQSVLPMCRGKTPVKWRDSAHFEFDFRNVETKDPQRILGVPMDQCSMAAIRDNAFKYVHFGSLPPLLFDIENDPGEMVNLALDPGYRDVALTYAQRMLSWRLNFAERSLTGFAVSKDGLIERVA